MRNLGIKVVMSILTFTGGFAANSHAQVLKGFTFRSVSVPGAAETDAYAIDNKNLIVGDYINAAGQQVGMLLKGSSVTSVSCPGGAPTMFTGVNAGGSAAAEANDDGGDSYCGNGTTLYLILHHGGWNFVPQNWGAVLTETVGINDQNQAVGVWEDANQNVHGFFYDLNQTSFMSLDVPGASATLAWGINNAGAITLQAIEGGSTHSYLFQGGAYVPIDVPKAVQSFVHGINNNGDIVYTVEDANGNSWGVFFYAALQQFYWFNQPDGRDNTRAYGINDEVVGRTGTRTLKIVGEYTPPGSNQNLAYEATVKIKP